MAFTVYVLWSLRNGRHYTGFTSRSMEERLAEHNRGYPKGWSARNRPFEVVYQETHDSEQEAAGLPRIRVVARFGKYEGSLAAPREYVLSAEELQQLQDSAAKVEAQARGRTLSSLGFPTWPAFTVVES